MRLSLGCALVAIALASTGTSTAVTYADACPGSGDGPCPYTAAHIIGQRAEGVLRFPEAVAVDSFGNVYVADQLSYVVQKFTTGGVFESEWGSFGGGPGQFGPIDGLAVDAAGNVYVVDSMHNRIEKFDPNGNFITQWGHGGTELGDFRFFSTQDPSRPPGGGIAVAGSYVYVVDSGNDRVERFNLEGGEPLQWGGYGNGPGRFSYPRGVAANALEVIVTDDNNRRVQKFDPNGNFQGAAGTNGSGPGQFGYPYGVSLDGAGNVYVADDDNHRIVKLNPGLGFARAWGGFGSGPGQLAFPRAVASDPAGNTYVADTANDRIQVFGAEGDYERTLGASGHDLTVLTAPRGLGTDPTGRLLVSDTVSNRIELFAPETNAFSGVWSSAVGRHAAFDGTRGIAVDPRGSVYVADPGDERIARLWGEGTSLSELGGPLFRGGAQLSGAGSVAVAPVTGTLYVADSNHNRVVVYGPRGAVIAKWGSGEGNGAPGSGPGEFSHPVGVAVGPAGEVYVADTNNDRIVKLAPTGTVLAEWGSQGTGDGHFRAPVGVAVDAAGNVYVLDGENNRVQVLDSNGNFLAKWGMRGPGLGEFSQPTAIAVDCNGDVYVADTNNNRVERFDPVTPGRAGCLAPSAWPPPLDVAPTLHVSLVRRAGVLSRRALALRVSCVRACKILVTATLAPRGGRGVVKLPAIARGLPPSRTERVRLAVGSTTFRRLRRALGRKTTMTARVNILAAGPTGRRTTATLTYTVTR